MNPFPSLDRFFFRACPPHALALLRIGFGAFLLFYWGLKLPHVSMIFSREGLILPFYDSDPPAFMTTLFAAPSPTVAWILFVTFLLSLLLFTLGAWARMAAALAALFTLYYWVLSVHLFGTSFDRLYLFFLLVFSVSGAHKTFSLHMWWRRGSFFAWEPISILPQRILALQVTATYLGVGWQKSYLPAWQHGEVLAYGYMGRWATAPAYWVARQNLPMWFFDALNYVVKYFEFSIPFGLWIRRYGVRWFFFVGGALFHTYIAIFLAIWWFLVLIPAYILFFEPEEVYRFLRNNSYGRIA